MLPSKHIRSYGRIDSANSSATGNRPNRPRPIFRFKRSWIKPIIKTGLILSAVGFVIGTGAVLWISRDLPDPNKLSSRPMAQSTKIFDRTGTHLLYEVYQNQKRTLVELTDIAPLALKALIATEDKNFYEHSGIKPLSIVRVAVSNFLHLNSGGGGASTITQQLVKNVLVGDKYSYWRKIKEAILSVRIEKKFSKDQILKMYINEIPYGSTNYGIESASQSYFHKSARDLTLPEAATLAAIIKAPSRYLTNQTALLERRNLVLRLMTEQGYINESEKTTAQAAPLIMERNNGIFAAPHFVLYVKQQLSDQYGEKTVDDGGLKVITTIDYDKQIMAEKIVKELGDQFAKQANANNASLVAMDPKTGQVLAMVGSRDFNNDEIDGQFNVAVLGKRQPGSSFKPFVYTLAWEMGYTPETVLYDVETNFDRRVGGNYSPKNYDGLEHGLVTMRSALQGSLNIPAVKTLYLVGSKAAIEFGQRFGYTTFTGDYGLSLVLGGAEVNLLEHTAAYAALANRGNFHTPVSILSVTSPNGDVLQEWRPEAGSQAITPQLADLTANVLSDNNARAYIFGLNNTLMLPGRPVATKTGTTNNNKDAWTMGYTPSLVTGVWVGNTTPSPMKSGGNTLAGRIWNRFMSEALKGTPIEQFNPPPPNDATKPILRGAVGGIKLPINKLTEKIAVSTTPESLIEERNYLPAHDILHYVVPSDPRGAPPANPSDDAQYDNWEEAVKNWVVREQAKGHALTLSDPPTEYDTPNNSELSPVVEFTAPTDNTTITSITILLQIKAAAPRGVNTVTYYIDDQLIGHSNTYPFDLVISPNRLSRGTHTIKAIASDDQNNTGQTIISINFEPSPSAP